MSGTNSKILWHFTGGKELLKFENGVEVRSKHLKSDDKSFEILIKILRSSKILTGEGKIKFQNEVINPQNFCCVAEIPIAHLKNHALRYGQFAIGFYRELLIEKGFRPVFYCFENDNDNIIHQGIVDAYNSIYELARNIAATGYQDFSASDRWTSFSQFISFIKTFDHENEINTVYLEREWRKIGVFDFGPNNIAMIICPNKFRERLYEYFEKDLHHLKFKSIMSYEDLVEH